MDRNGAPEHARPDGLPLRSLLIGSCALASLRAFAWARFHSCCCWPASSPPPTNEAFGTLTNVQWFNSLVGIARSLRSRGTTRHAAADPTNLGGTDRSLRHLRGLRRGYVVRSLSRRSYRVFENALAPIRWNLSSTLAVATFAQVVSILSSATLAAPVATHSADVAALARMTAAIQVHFVREGVPASLGILEFSCWHVHGSLTAPSGTVNTLAMDGSLAVRALQMAAVSHVLGDSSGAQYLPLR